MDGHEQTHANGGDIGGISGGDAVAAHGEGNAGFFSRIGKWFKGDAGSTSNLPVAQHDLIEPRGTFLRPWARRDQAINQLQEGFTALTDLMRSINDNLQEQNRRQDQLIDHLSALPQVLEQIPQGHRMQSETLKAIHEQIGTQTQQQAKLAEILNKISEGDYDQRKMIDSLRDRVESINETDQAISSNLSSLGVAMQGFSRHTETSAKVMEQLRENITTRDAELERVLHRQGNRFTTLLAIAIFLSVAALVAVGVIGYLGYEALQRMQ